MSKIKAPIYLMIAEGREPVRIRGERSARSYAHWRGYTVYVIIKESLYIASLRSASLSNVKGLHHD